MGCFSSILSEQSETMNSQNTQIDNLTEFRYIDGRRFHNVETATYPLPNDNDELDRLHLQHFLLRYIWQCNFSAPINHILSNPDIKILDVGCGAGSWSFDMATTYPLVEVVGIDISPLQPTQIKPKNFKFVKANVFDGLPFENNTFDFVFQRYMFTGCPTEKWPYLINELVRVLKPGGFLELFEPSKLFDLGPATQRFHDAEVEIFKQHGLDDDIYEHLEDHVQNQGQLENIKKEVKPCHYGIKSNNTKLSEVAISNFVTAYASFKPALLKQMKISSEEFDELAKTSEKELFEYGTYNYLARIYANKVINNNNEIKVNLVPNENI
ncbi:S-adenosyl-L-methionine-dependent methyltransferase [Gigaspora margarita]|uniref:S-adenosyl-L-methionine-dependent methyltransferase n=1 Tax=Gigaspora margarita TaxID=4874 RepID=A0A8H3XA06_GIGMA|nr:S-adenosyl-L-methionine-dependent methyltransferase [Gigaspora margarita]